MISSLERGKSKSFDVLLFRIPDIGHDNCNRFSFQFFELIATNINGKCTWHTYP